MNDLVHLLAPTQGSRTLITGGAGFIGSHLADRLLEVGHEVWVVDSLDSFYSPRLKEANLARFLRRGGQFLRGCLLEAPVLPGEVSFDHVIHLAARPGLSSRTPLEDYVAHNVVATHRLLRWLEGRPAPRLLIHVSTSSVYGQQATESEDARPRPISAYGITKLAAEELVLAAWRNRGLPVAVARLYSVYGPRERPDKLFPRALRCLARDEALPLRAGSLDHRRSFTHVRDAVEGLCRMIAHAESCHGEIFNLGSEEAIEVREALSRLERLTGRSLRTRVVAPVSGDPCHTRASIDKARRILGFAPSISLEEGLETQLRGFAEGSPGS